MTTQERLDPQYLRGVMDALELVASFIVWKESHPESNRTEKDFIHQALKKIESKVESHLDEVLGMKFNE